MGAIFQYKNEDGTTDEFSTSSSVGHAKSRYGTIGPYGLVSYHEDMATIVGDYYTLIPKIANLYNEDEIIREKIEYLHSYGFFTDEQLEIIRNPPEEGVYFWQYQDSIKEVSDCI